VPLLWALDVSSQHASDIALSRALARHAAPVKTRRILHRAKCFNMAASSQGQCANSMALSRALARCAGTCEDSLQQVPRESALCDPASSLYAIEAQATLSLPRARITFMDLTLTQIPMSRSSRHSASALARDSCYESIFGKLAGDTLWTDGKRQSLYITAHFVKSNHCKDLFYGRRCNFGACSPL